MKGLILVLATWVIYLSSCGQKSDRNKLHPEAAQLNNQAVDLVRHSNNPDSAKKAIELLDSATAIDSSCVNCYSNKIVFLVPLKQYDKAIVAVNKLLQLRPYEYYFYLTGGMLYELVGDTVAAKSYFTKSLDLCNAMLDTMVKQNSDFVGISLIKANNLVMLGDSVKANQVLKQLYENLPAGPEYDDFWKEIILSSMNKSKKALLDDINNPMGSSTTVEFEQSSK